MSDNEENEFCDEYCHPLPDILYTSCNVPGVGADVEEFETQFAAGCNCRDGTCSSDNSCPCVERFGRNYSKDGRLLSSKFDGPIMECNSECSCFKRGKCGNRLVQYGPLKSLQIFSTEDGRGLGLRSEVEIREGTFICEYAGEVISLSEAKRRVSSTDAEGMNYVFVLNEHLSGGTVLKTCVDPTVVGNVGRYINHSCRPNSAVVPVRVDSPVPRLCVFALRTLEAGEEITFHYGGAETLAQQKTEERKEGDRKPCLCGADSCCSFLPFDPVLL